jgi:hypothetical protein
MLAASNHRAGWIPVRKINRMATVRANPTGPVAEIALIPAFGFDSGPLLLITSVTAILIDSCNPRQGCQWLDVTPPERSV